MIYFDHNATTPYSPSVKKYIAEELINDWANPSSEHTIGYFLSQEIANVRKNIADFFECKPHNLFFTGSATESINTIFNIHFCKKNNIKHIITSPLEHHATLKPIKRLEREGISVSYVSHNEHGELNLEHLSELSKAHERALISIMYVNNESGVVNDIDKISKIAAATSSFIHIDAVQALGKIPIDLVKLDPDFMSFSGHKIGSLKGVGLLYAKDDELLTPLIMGGDQERGRRAGTYNFPAIKSLDLAIKDIDFKQNKDITKLRNYFEEEVLKLDKGIEVNCQKANRIFNTSNIYFKSSESRLLLLLLSELSDAICVSTGSACKTGSAIPSHVISEIYGEERSLHSMRVSFSKLNTLNEVKRFIEVLKERL